MDRVALGASGIEVGQIGVSSKAFTTGVYPRKDRFLYWFNEEYRGWMGREHLG